MKFQSRRDSWLCALLVVVIVMSCYGIETLVVVQGSWVTVTVLAVVGVLFPVSILTFTCYVIDDDCLRVHFGFFFWRIPYDSYYHVQVSSHHHLGPVLSLRQVMVTMGDHTVVLSPKNRRAFAQALHSQIEHHFIEAANKEVAKSAG